MRKAYISKCCSHKKRGLSFHQYIESRTKVDQKTGCWVWLEKHKDGWSKARHKDLGRVCKVGKASWLCFFGPIPKGLDVCHTCDNGHCANPMHLFLGTRSENIRDCVLKGRHPKAKLNPFLVKEMKGLRNKGASYLKISRLFSVNKSTAMRAIKGKYWVDV